MNDLDTRVSSFDVNIPYEEPRDDKQICVDRGYHRIERDAPLQGELNKGTRLCYDCKSVFDKLEQVYVIVPR